MIEVPLAFAFSGGIVAAFNPCGAAMFPAYVGYQLGSAEADDKVTVGSLFVGAMRGIAIGLSATAGFVVVFGLVGLILAGGGRVLGSFLPFAGLAVGVAITAVGLWLLISRQKIGIMAASRVNLGAGKGLRQVFLFGIAYAIASLSCALPIFLAAVGVVAGQTLSAGGFAETVLGSLAYGLGMGVIMIAAAVGVVFVKGLVQDLIRRALPYLEVIGNLAMVGAGGYLIYYWAAGSGRELLDLRIEQYF